ncbi:proline-rich domain-containing protein [Nonomuraea sp. NPDC050202]|uniref:proline-rich domain-containing protein n=1 Tax=Nonomuraea sp. NPDC050202 TaxID=3155035 RepID=UPI0033E7DBB8
MAYPPQPPPQGPWGPQGHQGYGPPPPAQGAPGYGPPQAPGQGRPGYGPPQGRPDHGQGQGPYGNQAGPPPGQYGNQAGPPPTQYGNQGGPPPGQYGNQGGPPPPYGPPPGNRNNPVLIGVIVALSALLLLGGGAFGAYAYLNSSGGPAATPIAQPSTPPASAPPSSPAPSSPAPSSPAPSPTPTESPEPSSTPSDNSKGPLDHTEFGNWNYSLKGEKYAARKVGGWTYDSCDPLDAEGVMADNNCESAIQLAYTAYGGNLRAVQIVLQFPGTGDAKKTANQLKNSADRKVAWRRGSAHSRYAYGAIYSGAYLNYVVVTVVTTNESAKPKARKFHTAMQTDRGVYFFLGRQDERVVTS